MTAMTSSKSTIKRIGIYSLKRLLVLIVTVVIGVFLTIIIANMGGYVDTIMRGTIREDVSNAANQNKALRLLGSEERLKWINNEIASREKLAGLDQPFINRAFKYMTNALTLDLGRALFMTSDKGSQYVRDIILERLPATLVLFGTSGLLLFFAEIFVALIISQHYGSFFDKLLVFLAPLSTSPAWFYGIFLVLLFAAMLRILPFDGMVDAPIPETTWGYLLSMLKHMILPVGSVALSQFFLNTYNWRTFFLIYSSEDYVEMARAKGLPARTVEREYVLRPTLPTIITSFALTLIGLWQGFIIVETIFNWPGLGRTYFQAVQFFDTPVIVGMTVINAYLLALTVFILDFVYAIVDPRVKVGAEGGQ